MWKFYENAQFLLSFGHFRLCASIQNLHTRKLGKILVFCAVWTFSSIKKNLKFLILFILRCVLFGNVLLSLLWRYSLTIKRKRNMKLCYTLAYLNLDQGEFHKSRESFTIFFQNREFI